MGKSLYMHTHVCVHTRGIGAIFQKILSIRTFHNFLNVEAKQSLVKYLSYRVFHANTPITKQHFSVARYENQILKNGLYSSWAPILSVDFVYGWIPRRSPLRGLLKELNFSITISEKWILRSVKQASTLKEHCFWTNKVTELRLVPF